MNKHRIYTEEETLQVIRESNDKQLKFLEETKDEKEYTVPNKVMRDNAIAIDWLLKYIESHCPPASKRSLPKAVTTETYLGTILSAT